MARTNKRLPIFLLAPVECADGETVLIGRTTKTIKAGTLLAFSQDEWGRPMLIPVPDKNSNQRFDWIQQFKNA